MENAVFFRPTKVIFGKGTESGIGESIAPVAKNVLLHYGSGSAERSGLLKTVRESLDKAGIQYCELGGVQGNPLLSLVYEGIGICRKNDVQLVLAVGGGSVIDSAKAIACGVPNTQDDVWEYFLGKKRAKKTLKTAVVLTIPGAGSEATPSMVITNGETNAKLPYASNGVIPVVAVLNPELTYTVPAYHAAAGMVDGVAHIMERYFTNTKEVDITDRLCESVIRTFIKYGKRMIDEPENYGVHAEIMWACKIAHDGTLGVGREEDWASHDIEHELSAKYNVSHGAGLAVVFPAWMRYVYPHDKNRFAQFASRVFDVEYDFENPDHTILEGIARMKAFFQSLGMPTTLRELGITDKADIKEFAAKCIAHAGGSKGNFVKLDETDIVKILEMAY